MYVITAEDGQRVVNGILTAINKNPAIVTELKRRLANEDVLHATHEAKANKSTEGERT